MKKISFVFVFVALLGFASNARGIETKETKEIQTQKEINGLGMAYQPSITDDEFLIVKQTCKVTVTYGDGSTATATISCTCSVQQACDAAYAILSVLIPG